MRSTGRFTLGWGAAAFLLTVSIGAAVRLASIGVETLEVIAEAPGAGGGAATGVVALIEPAALDGLSRELVPAIHAARHSTAYSFGTFSPGLPPFLTESSAMIETLEIALAAGVDAMVVRADRLESLERAADIAATGILTATIGALRPSAATHIRAGVDADYYAAEVSALIGTGTGGEPRIGYLCGLCSGAETQSAGRFIQSVAVLHPGSEVIVQRVDDRELGSIAAAQALLERGTDVTICDTPEGTVAMAQVVINANRVGAVRIVGFGHSDRIRSLVDDRVVEASIVADYGGVIESLFVTIDSVLSGGQMDDPLSIDRPLDLTPELSVLLPAGETP